jgi:hypothetical protein
MAFSFLLKIYWDRCLPAREFLPSSKILRSESIHDGAERIEKNPHY